jgi:hypothetical protein
MKKRRLIDVVSRTKSIKLLESYPMCWISQDKIDNIDDAMQELENIIKTLQSFEVDNDKLSNMFETIDKQDFRDITMFLTEKFCTIKRELKLK